MEHLWEALPFLIGVLIAWVGSAMAQRRKFITQWQEQDRKREMQMREICRAHDDLTEGVRYLAESLLSPARGRTVTLPLETVVRAIKVVERHKQKELTVQPKKNYNALPELPYKDGQRPSISTILNNEYPEVSGAPDRTTKILDSIDEGFET